MNSAKSYVKINLASKGLDFVENHIFLIVIWNGEYK